MNPVYKNLITVLAAGVLFSACTKNFEAVNTDPNRIEKISPGTLLNPIIYSVASFNTTKADDITFNLMQVMLPYPSVSGGIHRYDLQESAGNSTWSTYYRWLTNIKEMKAAAVEAGDVNYEAIALTLNAWIYANLTDAFGDVPMEEASRGDEGIFSLPLRRKRRFIQRSWLTLTLPINCTIHLKQWFTAPIFCTATMCPTGGALPIP